MSVVAAGNEAASWASLAKDLWAKAPQGGQGIEAVLGSTEHLKGQGEPGKGLLVSLQTRRGLPLFK